MKEKLIIKNFGPIRSVELELGKITILIGEQATGKSTVAKVLSVCRYFSYIVDDSSTIGKDYESSFVRNALRDWGLNGFERDDSYIKYINEDYSLKIISEKIDLGDKQYFYFLNPKLTPKSERFKNLIKNYNDLKPQREKLGIYPDWSIPHSFLTTDVKKVMNNPFYIQAERGLQSIFSLGKSSIQNLSDSLFNQFALLDKVLKGFKSETYIKPLNIEYKNIDGVPYFKGSNDDTFYKLSQGASGYQSTIPIILSVKYYSEVEKRQRTFIIEEPEINLFPTAQKKLMQFFVESVNKYEHSFLIPTHSPYLLSALNDLLVAYKRGQKNEKETKKVIIKEAWLNPKDLSVYELKEGKALSILDEKLGLISENILDDVSDEMNEEFEKLLDIK